MEIHGSIPWCEIAYDEPVVIQYVAVKIFELIAIKVDVGRIGDNKPFDYLTLTVGGKPVCGDISGERGGSVCHQVNQLQIGVIFQV